MNENVKKFEYAVRGAIVLKAMDYERRLRNKEELPFKRITYCNIGNPQQLGQKPITFLNQVLSLVINPDLLTQKGIENFFPKDTLERAKLILQSGGTGAYSESQGRLHVRENVAAFINRRDGYNESDKSYSSAENIFLSDGASAGVQACLKILIRGEKDGVMIPIPQYPLYSGSIPLLGGAMIPYYLDESNNWALDVNELKRSVGEARKSGIVPRGIVVINPGNPTGSCLTEKNLEDILKFSYEENVLLMADEVYQDNIYGKEKFVSFKKKLFQMPKDVREGVQLISFHSTSKGLFGECGKRGGYFELTNFDADVKLMIYKLQSLTLCPNLTGQITLDVLVSPPKQGDPSYALFQSEQDAIYNSLKRRAALIVDKLNTLPGISCQRADGALYSFPKITLPAKAIEKAKAEGIEPDMYYCLKLLDEIGLCVVPGSGFGQRAGEYHFRTTILPSEEHLTEVLSSFETFHKKFLQAHS
jgi:aspartate/methionine/tyrosine aminotransferase